MSSLPNTREATQEPTFAAGAASNTSGAVHGLHGRLFRKYLVPILALVCGALLVSAGTSLYFSYQENKAALSSLQEEKAVAAAARIEQYMQQIQRQLASASLPQLDPADLELQRLEFLKLLKQAPEITDLSQIGPDGREQLYTSRLAVDAVNSGKDRAAEPTFRNVRAGSAWYGPVYFRKDTEPYLTIAIRRSANGPVTVAEMNLKFVWDVVSRIKVGDAGKAYVVDSKGYLVADPDIALVLAKTDLGALPHVRAALDAPHAGAAMAAKDLYGTPVLTAEAPIESLGWHVFVEQPVAEVYARLDAAIRRSLVLLVAGLVVSALVAAALARGMVRPIQTLGEGAARIGAGKLDQRIEVRTGDELEALAERFNQMSAQLRESYAGLETKVQERTAELQAALDQQTAISDILRLISESHTDIEPVMKAVAERSMALCAAERAAVYLLAGDNLVPLGTFDALEGWRAGTLDVLPLTRASVAGRAVLDRSTVNVTDIEPLVDGEFTDSRDAQQRWGMRSVIAVPLLREASGYGAVALLRREPVPFTAAQSRLLETFARQASIAVDNVRLFREIQEKSRQLEIANKHKSDFLANMSHELRTPLNAIIGFSEVLLERLFGDINDKQDEYLHDIHSSGRDLLALINDILDLSKIEAGHMQLDAAPFDLPATLGNALVLIRERAQRHGIALSLQVEPGVGEVFADERKVKQIVVNLLSNAVKFTKDGGSVDLLARREPGRTMVSVRDTGVGIAPEDHAAVFEEFRQVGNDYTRKQEGTGLGLALSRRFVELHGGKLTLESELGKGSTFTFDIPAPQPAASEG